MTYSQAFKSGNLVLPSALLFHYQHLFKDAEDFLVWQFFYLQNTTNQSSLTPNQIADAIGKSVTEVNQSMSRLTNQGLLQYRTIELDGEIEVLFDATVALECLDDLLQSKTEVAQRGQDKQAGNELADLVKTFEGCFERSCL